MHPLHHPDFESPLDDESNLHIFLCTYLEFYKKSAANIENLKDSASIFFILIFIISFEIPIVVFNVILDHIQNPVGAKFGQGGVEVGGIGHGIQ